MQDEEIGSHDVQVLQTLAGGSVYPFAPGGEQTIRLAYERAICLAEHYIYIEDQYFWPCSIDDTFRDAAARGVKIILVLDHKGLGPWHNWLRQKVLERVRPIISQNVFGYHLQRPGLGSDIYVHSKLMIIDNHYVATGSANHSSKSLKIGSELQIAVVERQTLIGSIGGVPTQVRPFARNLRVTLWREHLALESPIKVDDTLDSVTGHPNGWPICEDVRGSGDPCDAGRRHAVCHNVTIPRWKFPNWVPNWLINPRSRN